MVYILRRLIFLWRRHKFRLCFVALLGLLGLALHGVNEFYTKYMPFMLQYDIQVVLEDGRPLQWDCLKKKYGFDEEDNNNILVKNVRKLSSTDFRVPNTVHFIFFGKNRKFSFLNYLSVLSAFKVQNPDVIMFHCDFLPIGEWWHKCLEDVPTLTIIKRPKPVEIGGSTVNLVFHSSDIARIEVLLKYGGIYLDYDVILIQSLDNLRYYPCVIGEERYPKFIGGVLVAERNALFLRLWYAAYKRYFNDILWDYNSGYVPYQLHQKYPNLLHVEKWRLTTPDWTERHKLFQDEIDWRELYSLHMMFHQGNQYLCTPERLLSQQGIVGSVLRNIYYGKPELPPGIVSQNHSCVQ